MVPGKPGLVLLAGQLLDFPIRSQEWAFIVAADGGARHALRQNVRPHHVIGDLDSLSPEDELRLMSDGVPLTRLPTAKDMTDGEAAIQWAIAQKTSKQIVIAGGLGGRFDHSLGSVILLEQLARAGLSGYVTDGRQQVYLLTDGLTVPGRAGRPTVHRAADAKGHRVWRQRRPLAAAERNARRVVDIDGEQ